MTKRTKEWNLDRAKKDLDTYIAWSKKHPVLCFISRLPYIVKNLPTDINYYIREKYQRANLGWAVSDVWGFDWYLARVIAEGCEWLKEHKHGCPNIDGFQSETDEGFKAMCAEWDRILDNIIYTFRTAQKIQDRNWMYPHNKPYFTREEITKWTKFCEKYPKDKYYIMTPKEVIKYRNGWKLFERYFFSLWD